MTSTKSSSLVRQTVLIVLVAQMVCAAVLSAAALLYERHTRTHASDVRLQGRSDSLLGAIQDAEDPDDNVTIDPAELKLPTEDIYAVYNQGGRLLGSSSLAPASLIARQADGFHDAKIGFVKYRVLQREAMRVIDRAENGGVGLKRPVTILYASPEGPLWHETFEAVRIYLAALALAAALTVLIVSLLVTRALSPLLELASAAEQLSLPALNFSTPPSVARVRELRPLAEVLADAVKRLRIAFAKEHQFVGDAAHELKTAVAVVRSSVQLLMLKRRTVEEYTTGLKRVLQDNDRVEVLVEQMLHLASLEESASSDRAATDRATTDLGGAAKTVLDRLRPYAEERNIPLHLTCSGLARAQIRPERALLLLSNLLMNAMQHSVAGQPVTIRVGDDGTDRTYLKVEDTGSGIGPDALPHLFERFYREDRSRSRDTGGAGLGLAICKSIVDSVGGNISIESEPKRGTCVTVLFITA